jgi:hypothetical protein
MENKQLICKLLVPVLQATYNLRDLIDLEFDSERECVIATFPCGCSKVVNVAMDSGTAMIRDIVRQLV